MRGSQAHLLLCWGQFVNFPFEAFEKWDCGILEKGLKVISERKMWRSHKGFNFLFKFFRAGKVRWGPLLDEAPRNKTPTGETGENKRTA